MTNSKKENQLIGVIHWLNEIQSTTISDCNTALLIFSSLIDLCIYQDTTAKQMMVLETCYDEGHQHADTFWVSHSSHTIKKCSN